MNNDYNAIRVNPNYEDELAKYSKKMSIDIDWLRKASYMKAGVFLTYGEHYNNIVNYMSKKNTNSYIYLKDFKYRLLHPTACINHVKNMMSKLELKAQDTEEATDAWYKDFGDTKYHNILWSDILLNSKQKEMLKSIYGDDDDFPNFFSFRKDKAVLAGGIAKVIKVVLNKNDVDDKIETQDIDMGWVSYDLDYSTYVKKETSYNYKKNDGDTMRGALKFLPKTIKTRTMREALKMVYSADFDLMQQMATLELIDEEEVKEVEEMNKNNPSEMGIIPSIESARSIKREVDDKILNDPFSSDVVWSKGEIDLMVEKSDNDVII